MKSQLSRAREEDDWTHCTWHALLGYELDPLPKDIKPARLQMVEDKIGGVPEDEVEAMQWGADSE